MSTEQKTIQDTTAGNGFSPEAFRPKGENPLPAAPPASTQVDSKQPEPRRKFGNDYKLKILADYEACDNPLARGELLRKEGLYHSRLTYWRQQRDSGRLTLSPARQKSVKQQQLSRENAALKKKLAQAEAIIELQKKVSEILSLTNNLTKNSELE